MASLNNTGSTFFADLLETLAQNGKPPEENGGPVNGDEPTMRHRSHAEEADASAQRATDSAKPYTAEQLDAVRRSVHVWFYYLVLVELGDADTIKCHYI